MATTKEYKDFIIEQFGLIEGITYKPMMSEYLLYYNGKGCKIMLEYERMETSVW